MSKVDEFIETSAIIISFGAVLLGLAGRNRKKMEEIQGVGATRKKRRIWKEIQDAQEAGIDLTDPKGFENKKGVLDRIAFTNEAIPGGRSKSAKPIHERYFNQLRRAYNSIAGTALPFEEAVVRNEYGDVILVYHDYHLDRLPQIAAEWVSRQNSENFNSPYSYGYWVTVAAIAIGSAKFIWKGTGVHRGVEELVFGKSAPAERKQRISYIVSAATRDKYPRGAASAGKYPEEWAHSLWERNDSRQDDQEITNGVLDAIRDTPSVGAAQQACIDLYMQAHQIEQPQLWQDVPF